MPQMAPVLWSIMFMFFLISLINMKIIIFFLPKHAVKLVSQLTTKRHQKTWSW